MTSAPRVLYYFTFALVSLLDGRAARPLSRPIYVVLAPSAPPPPSERAAPPQKCHSGSKPSADCVTRPEKPSIASLPFFSSACGDAPAV